MENSNLIGGLKELIRARADGLVSELAVNKARSLLSEPENDWSEPVIDAFKEKMLAIGFEVDEVRYSGFCCQGDGASFSGKGKAKDLIRSLELAERFQGSINSPDELDVESSFQRMHGRYVHECTMDVDLIGDCEEFDELSAHDRIAKVAAESEENELREAMEKALRNAAKTLYADLEEEWDRLQSDEHLIELCEANEYVFDEDGELTI
jgi:hypothetical protein